jgi:hypothetical protein
MSQRIRRAGIATVMVGVLAACSSGPTGDTGSNGPGGVGAGTTAVAGRVPAGTDGVTDIPAGTLLPQLDALPPATLTAEEQAGLIWMREEEKLAHDVYAALYDTWNTPIFKEHRRRRADPHRCGQGAAGPLRDATRPQGQPPGRSPPLRATLYTGWSPRAARRRWPR